MASTPGKKFLDFIITCGAFANKMAIHLDVHQLLLIALKSFNSWS